MIPNLFSNTYVEVQEKLMSFGNLNVIIWSKTIRIDHFYLHHLQYYCFLISTAAGNAYLEREPIQSLVC